MRELLEAAGFFIVVFLALHFSIQNFRIGGTSMHPTLIDEQHLIVSKISYARINPAALSDFIPFVQIPNDSGSFLMFDPPDYGDIIAFRHPKDPSRDLVKRVIGMPGYVIQINSGQVIRNGEPLREPYTIHGDGRSFTPVQVPQNSYYILGDNRLVSSDSRNWGFISNKHIIGRAWLSY